MRPGEHCIGVQCTVAVPPAPLSRSHHVPPSSLGCRTKTDTLPGEEGVWHARPEIDRRCAAKALVIFANVRVEKKNGSGTTVRTRPLPFVSHDNFRHVGDMQ